MSDDVSRRLPVFYETCTIRPDLDVPGAIPESSGRVGAASQDTQMVRGWKDSSSLGDAGLFSGLAAAAGRLLLWRRSSDEGLPSLWCKSCRPCGVQARGYLSH